MRRLALVFGFLTLLHGTGCTPPWSKAIVTPPNPGRYISETPTAAQLISQLNDTSQRIQMLECRDVWIDARQGRQDVSLPGSMVCQKNRNFRLTARMVGQPAVDIGSNEQEFWFWISKAEPPGLYFCSYADLAQGKARQLPFPFQPSWVMEALGMADRDPNGVFEPVKVTANTFELIEKTTGPLGQPVRKVTIFSRTQGMVVLGHRLEDPAGKEICTAQIAERGYDQANRVVVPQRVTLVWPAQQLTMKLKLDGTRINGTIEADRAQAAFNRPRLPNIPSYDLARVSDQSSGQVQRAGGFVR